MNMYLTKISKFTGTDYKEISRKARTLYKSIASKTKRKPYVRSMYFGKNKVFLDYFWQHLSQKNSHDRLRRLRYYGCALDLIKNGKMAPTSQIIKEKKTEILHRFCGMTQNHEIFCVQIKEERDNHNKHFMSVFPIA